MKVHKCDQVSNIMRELNYIVDLGEQETEFYDNLMALLEVLTQLGIINNENYDNAELKLAKIWGFNTDDK